MGIGFRPRLIPWFIHLYLLLIFKDLCKVPYSTDVKTE